MNNILKSREFLFSEVLIIEHIRHQITRGEVDKRVDENRMTTKNEVQFPHSFSGPQRS